MSTNKALSFDPDKFVVADAPPPTLFAMPAAWRRGLEALSLRHLPAGATKERWAQIVADATRLATVHVEMAAASGWSLTNLFGYDPDTDEEGLAIALRGGALVSIGETFATVKWPSRTLWHHPHMADDAPLLWSFKDRRAGR